MTQQHRSQHRSWPVIVVDLNSFSNARVHCHITRTLNLRSSWMNPGRGQRERRTATEEEERKKLADLQKKCKKCNNIVISGRFHYYVVFRCNWMLVIGLSSGGHPHRRRSYTISPVEGRVFVHGWRASILLLFNTVSWKGTYTSGP